MTTDTGVEITETPLYHWLLAKSNPQIAWRIARACAIQKSSRVSSAYRSSRSRSMVGAWWTRHSLSSIVSDVLVWDDLPEGRVFWAEMHRTCITIQQREAAAERRGAG